MYKKLLIITFSAFMVTACGGSSNSSSDGGDGGDGGGGGTSVGGQSGSFGDTAASDDGLAGTFNICPDSTVGSFSSFTQNGDAWCVKKCPDSALPEVDANPDGWTVYPDGGGNNLTCRVTQLSPGSEFSFFFTSPIEGCPENGCIPGSHPKVYVTPSAGAEIAGSYSCASWLFNQSTERWGELTSPAPFSLSLNADASNSATIAGASTTWTFADGSLILEGNRTFPNVAVGGGSFTSYESSTSIIRCKT